MNDGQLATAIKNYSTNAETGELITLVKKLYADGKRQKYTALLLIKMLEDVDPDMMSLLGDSYYQGDAVEKDLLKAEELFSRAAKRGSVRADYDIAWLFYDKGNYKQAIDYFQRCKNNVTNFTFSQMGKIFHCLGYAYSNLAEPDYQRAVECFSEAAEKYNNTLSYRQLGILAIQDERNRDIPKALRYFEYAAQRGDLYSVHEMAYAYLYGIPDVIERDLSKAEQYLRPHEDCVYWDVLTDLGVLYKRKENWHRSAYFFQQAWNLREDVACAGDLGYAYFRIGEYLKAEEYLKYADKHGDSSYSDFLGRMYSQGILGYCNKKLAIQYYEHAYQKNQLNNVYTCMEYLELLIDEGQFAKAFEVADTGETQYNDIEFVYQKAKLVLQGKARNISEDEAAEMLEDVARYDGYQDQAHFELGRYYYIKRRYLRAVKHLSASFDTGDTEAAVIIGRIYEKGDGSISIDFNKAYEWYSKAANAGDRIGKAEAECFRKGMFGGYKRYRHI